MIKWKVKPLVWATEYEEGGKWFSGGKDKNGVNWYWLKKNHEGKWVAFARNLCSHYPDCIGSFEKLSQAKKACHDHKAGRIADVMKDVALYKVDGRKRG